MNDQPVALVTGGARGIGAAIARRLGADGWAVAVFDRCADDPAVPYRLATPANLDTTVAAAGPDAIGLVGDVRSGDDLGSAVAATVDRFGGLDAAIAAAGVMLGGTYAWDTTDDVWQTVIDVNLGGVRQLARAAVPALLARPEPRRGRFVAIASAAGAQGLNLLGAYAAAKHGVVGLVRSLAADLGRQGVTANAVSPGSTATAMLDASAAIYGIDPDDFSRHHALGRLVEPDEVAAVVSFLCGPGGSAITGAVVPVDAGMTATR